MSVSDRARRRETFDEKTRLRLVETDLDDLESELEAGLEDFRKELHAMQRVLIGILVSLTTAAILLAVNIALGQ